MKRNLFSTVAAMVVVLGAATGCVTPTVGVIGDLVGGVVKRESPEVALVKAAKAAMLAADAHVFAYEQAMLATDVKDRTVTRAIRAYRKVRLGGLDGQLEQAYETTQVLVNSDIAARIQERASDPAFRRSWAEVKPYYQKSHRYFKAAGSLHFYASSKTAIGGVTKFLEVRDSLGKGADTRTKVGTVIMSARFLQQMAVIVPKLISNNGKLEALHEKLELVTDYQQAAKELDSAGGSISQAQLNQLQNASGQETSSGEVAFPSLFGTPDTEVAEVSFDSKLADARYCGKVQTALKARGHYTGRVDGKCGRGSRGAIVAFKSENGLGQSPTWTRAAEMKLLRFAV